MRQGNYQEAKRQAQANANRTGMDWLVVEHDSKGGYTIVLSGQTSLMGPDTPVQVHGLFETQEEAQAYIDGGASLRQEDGSYVDLKEMPYIIVPMTVQG